MMTHDKTPQFLDTSFTVPTSKIKDLTNSNRLNVGGMLVHSVLLSFCFNYLMYLFKHKKYEKAIVNALILDIIVILVLLLANVVSMIIILTASRDHFDLYTTLML